eukprot:752999-Hanusia_phi.AAC.3
MLYPASLSLRLPEGGKEPEDTGFGWDQTVTRKVIKIGTGVHVHCQTTFKIEAIVTSASSTGFLRSQSGQTDQHEDLGPWIP